MIEQAEIVLADLKEQLKQAEERRILFLGAVQGAEAVLESLKEQEKAIKAEDTLPKEKSLRKNGKNITNQ